MPTQHDETTQIKFSRQQPVYRNAQAVYQKPVYKKATRTVNHQVAHRVPYYQNVAVRVPITHQIPIYKDIPVPVLIPEAESDEEDAIINTRTINVRAKQASSSSSSSSEECSGCWNEKFQNSFHDKRRKLDISELYY